MSGQFEGSCLCGAVRFVATGQPELVVWCHCESCRKHTGAPVSVFVAFKRDAYVVTEGQITKFNSSPGRWRGFCVRCGSTLTCEGERSNETHFHVGAFRDAAQLQPTRHIFQEERLPWLHLGACGYAASPAACRWLSPPSVEFARHTTGIIGIISGAVRAGCTCRGEVSQRGDALGPVASACLPQVRADKRLSPLRTECLHLVSRFVRREQE